MPVLFSHPFASYCQKALIALYELGIAFETELIEGDEGRATLAALWPPASMPILRDGDTVTPDPNGVQRARSTLDMAYPTLDERLSTRQWLCGDAFTIADCALAPAL